MRWQCFLALGVGFLSCACNAETAETKPAVTKPRTATEGKQAEAAKPPVTAAPVKGAVEPAAVALQTLEEKANYMVGLNFGKRLKSQGIGVNLPAVYAGIDDILADRTPRLQDSEIREIGMELQKLQREKQKRDAEELAAKNLIEGAEFLAQNKLKPGVVTLESGLQYKIITAGTGPKAKASDKVEAHYRGTLIDGSVFDSSHKRNKPLVIRVTGVIKGWVEALQLMPVGSKWELYIPSELAYGARAQGTKIGANSTLIFEIELLGIK